MQDNIQDNKPDLKDILFEDLFIGEPHKAVVEQSAKESSVSQNKLVKMYHKLKSASRNL